MDKVCDFRESLLTESPPRIVASCATGAVLAWVIVDFGRMKGSAEIAVTVVVREPLAGFGEVA